MNYALKMNRTRELNQNFYHFCLHTVIIKVIIDVDDNKTEVSLDINTK